RRDRAGARDEAGDGDRRRLPRDPGPARPGGLSGVGRGAQGARVRGRAARGDPRRELAEGSPRRAALGQRTAARGGRKNAGTGCGCVRSAAQNAIATLAAPIATRAAIPTAPTRLYAAWPRPNRDSASVPRTPPASPPRCPPTEMNDANA